MSRRRHAAPRVPPLFLGLTILFWGWELNALPIATALAVIIELPRAIRWRWDFSAADLRRVWDLCVLLFLGAAVYSYAETDITTGPSRFMPWLPLILFPFAAVIAFSAEDRVNLSTYFWLLRRRIPAEEPAQPLGWFVPYWYFAVCLLAVSLLNVRDWRFYTGVSVLGGWLLWTVRSRGVTPLVWILVLALAIKGGWLIHRGMNQLQAMAEGLAGELIGDLRSPELDITQRRTAIGAVGRLKLSGRVLLRLTTPPDQEPPPLLRTASFNDYSLSRNRPTWSIERQDFEPIFAADADGVTWQLAPRVDDTQRVQLSMILPSGIGILPLPTGPVRLTELFTEIVETNQYGSVRTREALPLVRYEVDYTLTSTLDLRPVEDDLLVPAMESVAIEQVARDLGLDGLSPSEAVVRVADFFQQQFTYRRYLGGSRYGYGIGETALRNFLLNTRAGHCEYFATATTLLLRQAGVPARYAVGFAVPDAEPNSRLYLIRARHAHAWTLAYLNGSWQDIDNTPPAWEGVEAAQAAPTERITDGLSWLRYRFLAWRYYGERGLVPRILLGLLSPFLLWIVGRILLRKRARRPLAEAAVTTPAAQQAGLDSEFRRIVAYLEQTRLPRRAGETLTAWLERIDQPTAPPLDRAALRQIVALHYAHRFDPNGLDAHRRATLQRLVEAWLDAEALPAGKSNARVTAR